MCRALRVGAVVTKSSGSDDPEVQRIFKEWNLDNQFPRKPDCIVTYMIISLNSWRTVLS